MEEDANPAELSQLQNFLKRYKPFLIILGILMAAIGLITFTLVLYTWDRGQIVKGVELEIPLEELTIEEARDKLEQQRNEYLQRSIHFIADNKNFVINMKDLGFTYDYQEPLQEAYLIGREGTILDKAVSKYKASFGIIKEPNYQWDDLLLAEALTTHSSFLNMPAQDAHFLINPDNSLEIIPENQGKEVDLDSLAQIVKTQALKGDNSIVVPFKEVKPTITKKDLELVKKSDLISEYTTTFDQTLIERSLNIKLAAKAIDGKVLKPGEVFSFNNTVGPRTEEAGYQTAMIIEGNTFVPGLGGGVCQVSSTLYNAVCLAAPALSVVERSPHSLPVKYVPLGQDATVAYPNLDFKFQNFSEGYLLIRSIVNSNTLTFRIYGKPKELS
ncbi:VanW family protein [Desulfosporosinus hippei]|uniref:Putative peptidoglycan binding domain-containing protein n=1 Tax=Desulfosporosinus hippei DSM 8344 TaxID=1121419 RepID=A0A1G7YKQ3_9FIRM|nr:VanW family protein [Desulfosporosinus hippei]SDG96819.1 Putative peptidoglycan binding domain-containing protein [Desulfosporosinus hippei DSM 8344]